MSTDEFTHDQALTSLRRSAERLLGYIDSGAALVLLTNEVALACKRVHRLREIAGLHADINPLLLAVHAATWGRKAEPEPVVFDLDAYRNRQFTASQDIVHSVFPSGEADERPEASGVAEESDEG